MKYKYPICEHCGMDIPRGWDKWRNKPEVPSHHRQRKTCSEGCQSELMREKMESIWFDRKYA